MSSGLSSEEKAFPVKLEGVTEGVEVFAFTDSSHWRRPSLEHHMLFIANITISL